MREVAGRSAGEPGVRRDGFPFGAAVTMDELDGERHGDLVTVSLAGACRDPAFFPDPDRFDVHRENARQNLALAYGPHFCLGAHLARVEARAAIVALLRRLPGLRLDPAHPAAPRGVVFRKPPALHVLWDAATPPGSSVSPGLASSR